MEKDQKEQLMRVFVASELSAEMLRDVMAKMTGDNTKAWIRINCNDAIVALNTVVRSLEFIRGP